MNRKTYTRLSPEEIEVVCSLSKDYTVTEIVEKTGICHHRVWEIQKKHVQNPKRKITTRDYRAKRVYKETAFFDVDEYAKSLLY